MNPAHTTVAATPISLTAVEAAWAQFARDVHANRPINLRVSNSPAALARRVVDVEAQVLIFATWLEALLEDTAQNTHLARRDADYAKAVLTDLAGDLRGALLRAIEGVAA